MKTLSITTKKEIINLANELNIDRDYLYEGFEELNEDFEVDNYRFIEEEQAESILIEQYESDAYILGCFNDWFIAENTNLSLSVVKALQKAEAFSELGELILEYGIEELISEYVRLDGYGHAFGSYDHNYEEITINDIEYIYFRI